MFELGMPLHLLGKNLLSNILVHYILTNACMHRPLLPGTCHSTQLILLPLMTGPLYLEAVRLIDLNTNEAVDIRDLPDIVANGKLC
jgi:hypothetical protein